MKRPDEQGFTLIELLVVMIIIGVLAAIAVPVFLSQRQRAAEATVAADLRTVAQLMETYYVDQGTYAGDLATLRAAVPPPTVFLARQRRAARGGRDGQRRVLPARHEPPHARRLLRLRRGRPAAPRHALHLTLRAPRSDLEHTP
jgi:prepilin-type N-terminal cleavage/methylation domain-containing protein